MNENGGKQVQKLQVSSFLIPDYPNSITYTFLLFFSCSIQVFETQLLIEQCLLPSIHTLVHTHTHTHTHIHTQCSGVCTVITATLSLSAP